MKIETTQRGFETINHKCNLEDKPPERLVQQSSAIGDYEDAFDRPGSSFLWIGDNHHLNREEVTEFRDSLNRWLETGYLSKAPNE